MLYETLYNNLCARGKLNKHLYGKGSGLHAHHIKPLHSGGTNDAENFTYLTVREHTLAHFLLWKMYSMPNDLRAMHMLGANLTPAQRRITGEYCRDNKLGFHSDAFAPRRAENGRRAAAKCKAAKIGIFDPNNFGKWSSKAGKATFASPNGQKFRDQMCSLVNKEHASKVSKRAGKKPATNGIITKKFHTDEQRDLWIQENPGWKIGTHLKGKGRASKQPVTDGINIFNTITAACKFHNLTSATIISYLKKGKGDWKYLNQPSLSS